MAIIVGVRFKRTGKTYYFDPNGLEISRGDYAVVETARGVECGEVTILPKEVAEEEIVQPLKKVIRVATAEDKRVALENEAREKQAMEICQRKIQEHKLEMNLVEAEYAFDNSKIVFFFTADGRVDFRSLVRDLASVFKTRIELRQIGVRDEVKLLGGLGACGREVCCRGFLTDFAPVSIRMAKDQSLSLNPAKISGLCGRLMCCLGYEQPFYQQTLKRCPKRGSAVQTSRGQGTVQDVNILRERVKVRFENSRDQSIELREYSLDELENRDGVATFVDAKPAAPVEENDVIPDVVFYDGSKTYVEKPASAQTTAAPAPAKPERPQPRQGGDRPRAGRGNPNRQNSDSRSGAPNGGTRGGEPRTAGGNRNSSQPRRPRPNRGDRQPGVPNSPAARAEGAVSAPAASPAPAGAPGAARSGRRRPRPNQAQRGPRPGRTEGQPQSPASKPSDGQNGEKKNS
ncbi:MAG: regulatory iron-sulfur-containing complex subunit RicT [Eubacteriales bacterium]|nr:regulatory iron-sulfur-containing complex subunit RicT [Eubacteriales bacterium]